MAIVLAGMSDRDVLVAYGIATKDRDPRAKQLGEELLRRLRKADPELFKNIDEAQEKRMEHSAKVLADSLSPMGVRLTTMEVTLPRIVLAEFNTHRMLSRNSASSRAIPVEKMIRMVEEHPYIPTHWGKNQKGMQADQELTPEEQEKAKTAWLAARGRAIEWTKTMLDVGVHKQITNRLLEPFMWHTIIVSATDWDNFFHLRCHKDAHPEIRKAADLMKVAMDLSTPAPLEFHQWHLPLTTEEERKSVPTQDLIKISIGRCARVSYLTHDGQRDLDADVELFKRLLSSGHMSPLEHVARPTMIEDLPDRSENWEDQEQKVLERAAKHYFGNFRGWLQYRKTIYMEQDILSMRR